MYLRLRNSTLLSAQIAKMKQLGLMCQSCLKILKKKSLRKKKRRKSQNL